MDYAKLADKALKLLTKHGQDITLRTTVVGDYNPSTGTATTTVTDTTRKGVIFDYNLVVYGNDTINNTLVQAGDKRLYLDANGVAPSLNDQVIVGGVTFQIKNIKDLSPAGTCILFDCTIRR